MSTLSRRLFLERALRGAAAVSVTGLGPGIAQGAAAREARAVVSRTPLGEHLSLVTGGGANVVALRAPEGVLLVDGGLRQHAGAVLEEVLQGAGTRKLRVLFNTHWHPEQTGLNERAGRAGASIVAHENTRLWLSRPIKVDWLEKPCAPLPPAARPNRTTYTVDELAFGGEAIEYGYMRQAHTDGDLYVYFRQANVLAAGGVVSGDGWPLLDWQTGGWIGGLVAGYDKLLKLANAETRIVPASGPVLGRADLQAHRDMYFAIYERVVACLNKGLGPDEAVATEPAKEFAAQWGDPTRFVDSAFRSLWGHFAADA